MNSRLAQAGRARAAEIHDVEAMLEIYGPIVTDTAVSFELEVPSAEDFAGRVRAAATRSDPWLVYEVEGRVLGYAYASEFRGRPAYGRTRETTVYVHPEAHGGGVGRQLLDGVLEQVASAGAHSVVAGIVPPNPASIGLHERLGYVQVAMFAEVGWKFGRWHDLGFWQKKL